MTTITFPSGLIVAVDAPWMRPTEEEWDSLVAEHFKLKEFRCNNGARNIKLDPQLVELCQKIRDELGKPLHVNSGFRTEGYNREIGGAQKSQHVRGTAADLTPRGGVTVRQLYLVAKKFNPGGLGGYDNFVHVDVRKDGPARWGRRY